MNKILPVITYRCKVCKKNWEDYEVVKVDTLVGMKLYECPVCRNRVKKRLIHGR
jgi:predicted nucleic acid-binding Zn ribbon protein